jgi:hypothetical protein
MKELITIERLKSIFQSKNYQWNPKLNLIGVRTNDQTPDKFNDYFCLVVDDKIVGTFECTTDPGVYWLKNPGRINGTAILPPGQYVDSWTIGTHKTYQALVQCKTLPTWRDANKNEIVDYSGHVYNDVQGLNIHRGHETWLSKTSKYLLGVIKIDKYSAACQVLAFKDNFDMLIACCLGSKKKYFTYTLIVENDFK